MPLSNGCNHVTVVTRDMDQTIAFYSRNFDAEITLDLVEDGVRHVLLDLGGGFCLLPFQFGEHNQHADGLPDFFARGHIDHFAIDFADVGSFQEARRRLVADGASSGQVRDFGMVKVMVFEDPDGMQCELAIWRDERALTLSESRVEEFTAG